MVECVLNQWLSVYWISGWVFIESTVESLLNQWLSVFWINGWVFIEPMVGCLLNQWLGVYWTNSLVFIEPMVEYCLTWRVTWHSVSQWQICRYQPKTFALITGECKYATVRTWTLKADIYGNQTHYLSIS